jgi:hypothetical protein
MLCDTTSHHRQINPILENDRWRRKLTKHQYQGTSGKRAAISVSSGKRFEPVRRGVGDRRVAPNVGPENIGPPISRVPNFGARSRRNVHSRNVGSCNRVSSATSAVPREMETSDKNTKTAIPGESGSADNTTTAVRSESATSQHPVQTASALRAEAKEATKGMCE